MTTSKEKILLVSEELFWLQGYKNTSINDIIKASEVSKGSFFHFFPDKKSLFVEVIDHFYKKEMTSLLKKHFDSKKPPKVQLLDFCKDMSKAYKKHQFKGGCLLGNLALELSDIDEDFRRSLNNAFDNWRSELIKVLKKTKTKRPPEEIANFIIWGLEGLTLTAKVHKKKSKHDSEFKVFLDLLIQYFL